ncbi:UBX domain-containing protein 6 [Aphelenchoides fujianensis]|nr:UBX domain-containing protein 6 [Aphelenchoides fujianensis]
MNKLKDFLNKKKTDKKFKKAGQGHTVGGSSTSGASSGSTAIRGPQQPSYVPPSDSAQRREQSSAIADALDRRLKQETAGLSAGQRRIREQARLEYEAEQRRLGLGGADAAEQQRPALTDERDGIHEFEHSDQISTVLYTCDLFDEHKALPKQQLVAEIESFLRETAAAEPVEAAVLMIHSLNKGAQIEQGVPILVKYVTNIVNSPNESKFRRIKTSNKIFQEKVAPLKGGADFLKAVGFLEDDQQNADGGIDKFLALPEPTEEDLQLLENAVSALESGSAISIKLYRDPKVFRIDPTKPIPKPEIPADFFVRSAAELKQEQRARAEAVEKLTTLRTSKMREDDARLRQYTYKYTLIRVRFPNNFLLQGVFNVHENFSAVREFLAEWVADQAGEFVLTDPTSDRRFEADERNLNEYGLVPAALVHFDWDKDTLTQLNNARQKPAYLRHEHEQTAQLL